MAPVTTTHPLSPINTVYCGTATITSSTHASVVTARRIRRLVSCPIPGDTKRPISTSVYFYGHQVSFQQQFSSHARHLFFSFIGTILDLVAICFFSAFVNFLALFFSCISLRIRPVLRSTISSDAGLIRAIHIWPACTVFSLMSAILDT